MTLEPLLDERRLIDGVWHVWCGGGWIAQCYADNVVWHIQVTKKNGDKPPAIRMGAAPKRPVAFRAKNELGVWIYYDDEVRAAAAAEKLGTEYQGLYVRDGT